ncbi:MAG: hypothetical protein ACFCU7_01170 [Pleurocapsa sp.]
MRITQAKIIKLLFGVLISCSLFVISGKTLAKPIEITVDVNQVVADTANNPMGIGLNFIGDSPLVSNPLQDIKVGTLRFATNEYYLFDRHEPKNPRVSIQDPNLWQVSSFSKPDGSWWGRLNFDDFMSVCQSTKAEPFVVIAIDAIAYTGDAPHATPEEVLAAAVEWVKYANIERGYNVTHWEIGNESNIENNDNINWTPEDYAQTVVQFSQAMKAVDPSIKIGANGMRIKKNDDWWARIMPIIKDDVDFLITHQYSWQKNYQEWKDAADEYDYNIQDAVAAIKRYNPSLRLNITENSSFNPSVSHTNNTWKMLHNFEMLGQTLRFEQVDYIHFWTSRWLEQDSYAEDNSAFDANYQLMPIGYPLKVWNNFLNQKLVYSTKAAGKISSWASYDPKGSSLNVFLLNKDSDRHNVSLTLNNYTGNTRNERWVLQGDTPESTDVTWNQSGSASVRGSKLKTELKPLSITVIALSDSTVD